MHASRYYNAYQIDVLLDADTYVLYRRVVMFSTTLQLNDLKASFSTISTDLLCLPVTQMTRSRDLSTI